MKLNNEKSRSLGSLVLKAQAIDDLLLNNLALAIEPETLGTEITEANAEGGFTRDVKVAIVNSAGETRKYFNGKFAVSVAKESTAGTVSIDGATEIELVEGEATITITYGGTWEANDTCTLTVGTDAKVAGIALVAKTSVDTLV